MSTIQSVLRDTRRVAALALLAALAACGGSGDGGDGGAPPTSQYLDSNTYSGTATA